MIKLELETKIAATVAPDASLHSSHSLLEDAIIINNNINKSSK